MYEAMRGMGVVADRLSPKQKRENETDWYPGVGREKRIAVICNPNG